MAGCGMMPQDVIPNSDDSKLDFNEKFIEAFNLLENSKSNVFVTGQAGTGKSTLLQYFRDHTTKNVSVLAPTGVAAVNVVGQTIHSFFHFKPDVTVENVEKIRLRKETREIFQHLDAIIIDEISMVRADLLDCIDRFLRKHGPHKKAPFGGLQMIFFGDLYQLPPVVTREEEYLFREVYASPYFFSAEVLKLLPVKLIDLELIYRQKDDDFIDLLSAIRNRTVTIEHMRKLNRRLQPDFIPDEDDFYIYLTTTNALADRVNKDQLRKTPSKIYHCEGRADGKFEERNLPTKSMLELKVGAQVMLLNNDSEGRWINGSIGKILEIKQDLSSTDIIFVELEDGRQVEVTPFRWEMFRFSYNEFTEKIESESVGSFTQYPLKLAWAVTIHKSQGKTFTKVVIDIGHGTFAHGQMYVALSRCTSLEGLILKKPISERHILLDPRIVQFMENFQGSF